MNENTALSKRFYRTGPLIENIHLVDLFLYDSSLFENILIVEAGETTVIVDMGTSKSLGAIKNYLAFSQINLERVLLIPTHHHFDHIGGLAPLIDFLKNKGSKIEVLVTAAMVPYLTQIGCYEDAARKGFNDLVGEIRPISEKYLRVVSPHKTLEVNNSPRWLVELIPTAGHCPDHTAVLLTNPSGQKMCYLGEAFGINLQNSMDPIPASSAPDFDAKSYLASIHKIIEAKPDVAFFSHFGGISGFNNIRKTGLNAITKYYEFRDYILYLHEKNPKTAYITEKMYARYSSAISTLSLNEKVAQDLAFTIVYGFLQDLGLKKRK